MQMLLSRDELSMKTSKRKFSPHHDLTNIFVQKWNHEWSVYRMNLYHNPRSRLEKSFLLLHKVSNRSHKFIDWK